MTNASTSRLTVQEIEKQIAAASILNDQGDYVAAEAEWLRLFAQAEKVLTDGHPIILSSLYNGLAVVYEATGRYSDAESLYTQALDIRERVFGPEHIDTANTLNNLAGLYGILGHFNEAKNLYLRALTIFEKNSESEGLDTADILYNLAGIYHSTGHFVEAEDNYNKSLSARMKFLPPQHQDIACSLNGLAVVYEATGNFADAESTYLKALNIFTESLGSEHHYTADCLQNLASIFESTGRFVKSLEYFSRSLAIRISILGNEHPDVATSLIGMSRVLELTGQFSEAEERLLQALKIVQQVFGSAHHLVAYCLNSIARVYHATSRFEEAADNNKRSIALCENALGSDHPDVAYCLTGLAETCLAQGNFADSIAYCKKSMSIYGKILPLEHPDVTKNLYILSLAHAAVNLHNAAILWGKLAVNAAQKLRENVYQSGIEVLSSFDGTVCKYYEHLASLLIKAGRYGEASVVMGMLKVKEQFEMLRRDTKYSISSHTISYNESEQFYEDKFNELTGQLAALGKREEILASEKNRTHRQNDDLQFIRSQIMVLNNDFSIFLDTLQESIPLGQINQLDQDSYKLINMADAASGTVALITITAENEFHTILTTSHGRKAFTSAISSKELATKALTFISLLKDPEDQSYLPFAKDLYDVILRPIEQELSSGCFTTILWMLNGVLRLLPVSALHDGERFVVEKFNNVCITTISRIGQISHENWNGLGMGVTNSFDDHSPLPAVKEELEGIISQSDGASGIIPGKILLDGEFTREAMVLRLADGFKAVHIASHFELNASNETMSYLLLGDGSRIRMDELRSMPRLFKGVDLVAFSACSTGLGTSSTKGRDVDGIGYLGEMQGAKSVLATLWPVEDKSTSMLMREFYRLRESGLSKAEALQTAQLQFVLGEVASPNGHDFTHPYFWAPFILIGSEK